MYTRDEIKNGLIGSIFIVGTWAVITAVLAALALIGYRLLIIWLSVGAFTQMAIILCLGVTDLVLLIHNKRSRG